MVIGIHQYNIVDGERSYASLFEGLLSHGLFTVAVPVFFMISGYLFFSKVDSIQGVFRKQIKRIRSVLMPFLVWSAAYFLFFFVGNQILQIPMESGNVTSDPMEILACVLMYRYCFPLWYMAELCVFILLSPIVYGILKKKTVFLLTIVLLICSSLFTEGGIRISVYGIERTICQTNFLLYYVVGAWFAHNRQYGETIWNNKFYRRMPLGVLAGIVLMVSAVSAMMFDRVISIHYKRLLIPGVVFFYVGFMIQLWNRYLKNRKINLPPVSTIMLYGLHSAVGIIVGQTLWRLISLPKLVEYFCSFVIVTLISMAIDWIMKRWMRPVYRIFVGLRG